MISIINCTKDILNRNWCCVQAFVYRFRQLLNFGISSVFFGDLHTRKATHNNKGVKLFHQFTFFLPVAIGTEQQTHIVLPPEEYQYLYLLEF